MGDGDGAGKGSDKAKRPSIPKTAPKEVKEFVGCKADSLEIKPGELDWIDLPLVGAPTVSFEEDPAKPGTVKATVKKLGVSITITVKDGQLDVDASGIPGAEKAKEWAKGLNEWLKQKKKKIGGIALKNGALSITKSSIAPDKKEGVRGAALPTMEKVGAGALLALVTLGGVLTMNAGDDTTRSGAISTGAGPTDKPVAPKLAVGGFCVHHETPPAKPGQSVIELRAVVEGVPPSHGLLAKFESGPNGGSASGVGKAAASDGFVDLTIDVTGRGPGTYSDFSLSDQTTGATLGRPVALGTFEVVPRDTRCPGRDALVRKVENSSSSKPAPAAGVVETTDAPPWSLAIAGGIDTLIIGGLLLDRVRRRRELGADFDEEDEDEDEPPWWAGGDATGRGRERVPSLVGDDSPSADRPEPPTEPIESVLDDLDTGKATPLDKEAQPEHLPSLAGNTPPMGGDWIDDGGMNTIEPPVSEPTPTDAPESVLDDLDHRIHPDEIA